MKFMGIVKTKDGGGGAAMSLPESMRRNLSEEGDLHQAAANLFAYLRELDRPEYKGIAVMPIPDVGLGVAIKRPVEAGGELRQNWHRDGKGEVPHFMGFLAVADDYLPRDFRVWIFSRAPDHLFQHRLYFPDHDADFSRALDAA
jgi:hypothetical protein